MTAAQLEELARQGSSASLRELRNKMKIFVYICLSEAVQEAKAQAPADQNDRNLPFKDLAKYLVGQGPDSAAGQAFLRMHQNLGLKAYDMAVLYDMHAVDFQPLIQAFGDALG